MVNIIIISWVIGVVLTLIFFKGATGKEKEMESDKI